MKFHLKNLGDDKSFYDVEDVPSNKLGARFGSTINDEFALSTQLRMFLESLGVIMDNGPELENHVKWIEKVHPPGQEYHEKQ